MPSSHSQDSPRVYNRGPSAPYTWSARFELDPRLNRFEILGRLRLVAEHLQPVMALSGAVESASGNLRSALVLGLNPHEEYGTPSIRECETVAAAIELLPGWRRRDNGLPGLRVITSRRRGLRRDARVHTMQDVKKMATAHNLRPTLTQADAFLFRHLPKTMQERDDPAVIIGTTARSLASVLQLGHDMGQTRIVAEITGQKTQVYEAIE